MSKLLDILAKAEQALNFASKELDFWEQGDHPSDSEMGITRGDSENAGRFGRGGGGRSKSVGDASGGVGIRGEHSRKLGDAPGGGGSSDLLDLGKPKMPKYEKGVKNSTVPIMQNKALAQHLKPYPEKGKINTEGVVRALQEWSEMLATPLGELSPDHAKVARAVALGMDEAEFQMQSSNSGRDWYKENLAEARATMSADDVFPELKDNDIWAMFIAVTVPTSYGANPTVNMQTAAEIWTAFRATGFKQFQATKDGRTYRKPLRNHEDKNIAGSGNGYPGTGWFSVNSKGQMNGKGHAYLTKLLNQFGGGVDGLKKCAAWLNTPHPVEEIHAFRESSTKHRGITEMAEQFGGELPGMFIMGPKGGAFGMNLQGDTRYLTSDMWWTRTWNRWMGSLTYKDASDDEGTEMEPGEPRMSGEQRIDKLSPDVPQSSERTLMGRAAKSCAEKLNMDVSEFQAVMWYYEQALYKKLGATGGGGNYADAAKRWVAIHKKKSAPAVEQQTGLFG